MTTITSFSAFPCISRASQPENLSSGPKNPPTFESIGMSVKGERLQTNDFPAPAYCVIPQAGPPAITISFSGSSHFVEGVVAFHRYHKPKPFPPTNFSFIIGVTAFDAIVLSEIFTYKVLLV